MSPIFEYGIQVWQVIPEFLSNKLELIQTRPCAQGKLVPRGVAFCCCIKLDSSYHVAKIAEIRVCFKIERIPKNRLRANVDPPINKPRPTTHDL